MKKQTIEPGDRVEVLDDTLGGVVTAIAGNRITIQTDEDFLMTFNREELVKTQEFYVDMRQLNRALRAQKEVADKPKPPSHKKKVADRPLVVDLHIDKLTGTSEHHSDFDLLNLQLKTAESQLQFALRKKIRRVVFIHGVGKGVLRMELETLLRRYDNLEFYDADYSQYGRGATEVRLYQNS